MEFEKNVFVNCPFDEAYYPLLRPLLFTLIYLGFNPRIALETLNSGKPRIEKIAKLIEESAFAIHDLSRIKALAKGDYFRLNMPFELGLDVGCSLYKKGKWEQKKCLILEAHPYRYQKAISDLSNSDVAAHGNSPEKVVREVRNWLNNETDLFAPGPSHIWGLFLDFMSDNYENLKRRKFSDKDVRNLPVRELTRCMEKWVKNRKGVGAKPVTRKALKSPLTVSTAKDYKLAEVVSS